MRRGRLTVEWMASRGCVTTTELIGRMKLETFLDLHVGDRGCASAEVVYFTGGVNNSMGHLGVVGCDSLCLSGTGIETVAWVPVDAFPVQACRGNAVLPRGMPPGPRTWSWLAVALMFLIA